MAIKAGDIMATIPGSVQTMIFDGSRMRVLWTKGHGDGDPSKETINRCQNTVKGHPTWKLYCGDLTGPIISGNEEPPHYVYLDDRACYAIYSSHTYTRQELNTFWPFDFDNFGNIRRKRPNRGRPAYLDDSYTDYAKGRLRHTTKIYEFTGLPVREVHKPAHPVKLEEEETEANSPARISLSGAIPVLPSSHPEKSPPKNPISSAHIRYEHVQPKHYVSGAIDGTVKPQSMSQKAIQGSPYLDIPAAAFRTRPRSISGDLAARFASFSSKRKAHNAFPVPGLSAPPNKAPKRTFITEAFGIHELDATSEATKIKVEEADDEKFDITP
ncbi:hypothetical protein BDW02DRAFT_494430 [Decorospora gaudefroyi]|uniref:Uncharacterized protein n=1 Tax=Decorospora gaudefroyi TaxID=184978 RepID=A0A6A5KK00_9PLEO|nr:hypothetical protein BDW02DRAFT_494430 [Decorospora gaudefroyi]